jgi:hypothetical protein
MRIDPDDVLLRVRLRQVDQIDPEIGRNMHETGAVWEMYNIKMIPHPRFSRVPDQARELRGHPIRAFGQKGDGTWIDPTTSIRVPWVLPNQTGCNCSSIKQHDWAGCSPNARFNSIELPKELIRSDVDRSVRREQGHVLTANTVGDGILRNSRCVMLTQLPQLGHENIFLERGFGVSVVWRAIRLWKGDVVKT